MILGVNEINWSAVNVFATVAMAVGLFWVGRKASKIDALEAKVDLKDADLKRATEASVDLKLATQAATVAGELSSLKFQCAAFEQRMASGHTHMTKLDEAVAAAAQRDNDLRVELMRGIADVKDNMVTKDYLRDLLENRS